ncbi:MAG: tetratricopeptide repeat protein [bacterium]|nr:tetratricopeptide repeat protein [bacterium]
MFTFLRRFAFRRPAQPRERALWLLRSGRPAEAETLLGELAAAPELDATDRAFLLNKRGVARIALGRAHDAREDFEAALALDPAHVPAIVNLGNLSLEGGDVAAAISQYERAIALDPDYAPAHLNLGAAYKRCGRFADGVRELRLAQRLEGRRRAAPTSRL